MSKTGERDVYCRFTYPFQIFPRHQPGMCPRISGPLGKAQRYRYRRHGGLYAPGVARRIERKAGSRGRRALYPSGGVPPARRLYGRAAASPLCGDGRNQFHLQKRRQGPQGTQRHPSSQPRGGGNARAKAGGNRQHPFGRAADSGIGLPRPAGNHLGGVPGRGLHPGAHLDAALLAVRRVLRV